MSIESVATTVSIEDQFGSGAYSKRPLTLIRGAGCTVWDDTGNAYLDATSGMGVALLGHAHPAVTAAIQAQAAELITSPEIFYNPRRAELYTLLHRLTGFEHFFLCNSGTEAIEGALKIARLLTGRSEIVAAKRAFHGRTLGALGLTWTPAYREPFTAWTPNGVTHIVYNSLEEAERMITDQTAAVVVEAIQGEGGVYPAEAGFLQGLRRLCDKRGALLIVDEIQTGLGRTGRWFGYQHAEVVPDMITLGKGIAGGIPMGIVAWDGAAIENGTHGSTFGGNPLACAAAVATLQTLQQIRAPERSAELGGLLLDLLREHQPNSVRDRRGRGLMVGLELRGRVTPVIQALQAQGVLALVAGRTVLRLLPPLVISEAEVHHLADTVLGVLRDAEA
ncbi:MAG: aspartate aminotransferase family protein [bacterium]|nr:aspartate aminotransferase family protein [bacterium]